ncbi:MAG: alpha-1,2-fucosyltransferase, partial [Leptospiraceae bacterium]|nr:alpha-1,2-fucosyltransferase [Leptospiraceae bacterium]
MIFFIASGRLGNQLFQYAFLQTIKKEREKIVVYGFDELLEVFDGLQDIFPVRAKSKISKFLLYQFIKRFVKPFIYFLVDIKVISSLQVDYEYLLEKYRREKTSYTIKHGLLKNVLFVKEGYFQSEKFFKKECIKSLKIKEEYISKAKEFMSNIPEKRKKVFVHIRKSDYGNFRVFGKSPILPIQYFYTTIEWFLKNIEDSFFIFLSDEPETIKEEFHYLENKIISTNDYGTDFAIMSMCEYGILSPSSFGWWGAYFMKNKKKISYPFIIHKKGVMHMRQNNKIWTTISHELYAKIVKQKEDKKFST